MKYLHLSTYASLSSYLVWNNRTFNISWEAGQDIEKLNKIANKEDIVGFEYTDQEANAIKIELAFKNFFNEINYARAIGVGDIMPSVWAYCVSNMKNKRDLDEVNNANISKEHKEIICYILENSHDNCMETLNKFLLRSVYRELNPNQLCIFQYRYANLG